MHWIPGKLNALLESLEVAKKFHMLVAVGTSELRVPLRLVKGIDAIWDRLQVTGFLDFRTLNC